MTKVTSAWRVKDFRRVWSASAFSSLGAEIGELAIPVLALVTLGASAAEFSLIRASLLAPYLLLTLWLGVIVDRRPRRPLMIVADLGRGILLLVVCVLALAGWLTVPMLVVAALLIGSLTVLYSLADFSFLPLVVERGALIDANARITAMQSVIGVAGVGLGGLLVQALTAPLALVLTALGYLASGGVISRVRVTELGRERAGREQTGRKQPRRKRAGRDRAGREERAGRDRAGRTSAVGEAKAGIVVLLRHRVLRALVMEASIWNLGNEVLMIAVSVLLLRNYGFGPVVLGFVLMSTGVGAFAGSMLSSRLTARFGYGRSLIAALLVGNTAPLVGVLAVSGAGLPGVVGLAMAFVVSGVGIGIANSQAVSLRQLAVEPELRGRVNAGYRLVSWGALSIGALAGGVLVTGLGPWTAGILGAGAMAVASAPVVLSPVRRLRTLEEVESP